MGSEKYANLLSIQLLTIRKILLLGSGFVAKPTLDYLARDSKNHITVGYCPLNFFFGHFSNN